MTLRARLVAAFTVLLLAALATLSVVANRSTTNALLTQVDEDLRQMEVRVFGRSGSGIGPAVRGGDALSRGFALIVVDETGAVVDAVPSGFTDDPDPLPASASFPALMAAPGSIATIASEDGTIDFRAIAVPMTDGGFQIGAIPLDDIDAATDELIAWLTVGAVVVALAGGMATWLIVRRALRPVDTMVDTAAAIADGDLTQRVPRQNSSTELGRLGDALNDMLAQLDDAFAHERASQAKLNQFVADASHELRTPLAALAGYADLYRKGALSDPADLDNAMTRIRKESGRMQRLVDDLLLLARLDRGQALDCARVDIASIISDAIADSQAIEPDRPITYDGPNPLVISGDEHRLAQVITNLLANARAHTPPRTLVRVTTRRALGSVEIEVADFGPGIADDQLGQLFDRFHRGGRPPRQTGGAGLGLAIVAAIVGAHGGTITAANEPGRGAAFTITLPETPLATTSLPP